MTHKWISNINNTGKASSYQYHFSNEISWPDWTLAEKHAGLCRFVSHFIAARVKRMDWGMTLNQLFEHSPVQWHGVKLDQPDFGADSHAITLTVNNVRRQFTLHLMINVYW